MAYDHLPEVILEREIEAICAGYRITPENARALCDNYISRRPDLLRKILPKLGEQDVTRLKAYKTLMKDVRKHIYYYLRRYQPEKETVERLRQQLSDMVAASTPLEDIAPVIRQLLGTHISTQERLDDYHEFYETLFRLIDPPRNIIDVGCGIHPLSYPYGGGYGKRVISQAMGNSPDVYVSIDKQVDVIETLQIFAPAVVPTRLIAVCADIGEIEWEPFAGEFLNSGMFDVALMLKLIPVLARQQWHLTATLAALPARRMLITATSEAMTRKQNIRKREERFLREFIELTGRRVQAAFQVGHEFGFLLAEPDTVQ